jgi:hypothetical protein
MSGGDRQRAYGETIAYRELAARRAGQHPRFGAE